MSGKETGGPAFPTHEFHHGQMMPAGGMTLRDYFAAKAMQGFCAHHASEIKQDNLKIHCVIAYSIADAMLEESSS